MKKETAAFKINGKSLALAVEPPYVDKVSKYLDKLAFGELVDNQTVADNVGYSFRMIQSDAGSHPTLRPYTAKIHSHSALKRAWGNKKTIAALRTHKEICVA